MMDEEEKWVHLGMLCGQRKPELNHGTTIKIARQAKVN